MIRLLLDLPIEAKHGMVSGRVLQVVGERRARPLGRSHARGRLELYIVEGDAGEQCGVRMPECEVVDVLEREERR